MISSSSSSSLFDMHHQCVAPLAANSPHSGVSRAISIASSKVRLCRDRSFFRVANQEEWGRPTGLLQSLWGTAVRILLASADSSILIRCPNSMNLLFCMIEVRRGCSVRRRTSQLETRWSSHHKTNGGAAINFHQASWGLKSCQLVQSC